jgi:hypothetical protein
MRMTLEESTLDSSDGDGSVAHGKQSHDELTTHTEQLLPAFPFGVWTRLPSASVHHHVLSMAAAFSCHALFSQIRNSDVYHSIKKKKKSFTAKKQQQQGRRPKENPNKETGPNRNNKST